ncbi:hypothetical protein [Streptomyces sp. NPDC050263]|uniref:hypothetical protein n=1 Tax=Streptomyces sp. NPDC050263 TaxID=3155037 RepID=UPI00342B8F28
MLMEWELTGHGSAECRLSGEGERATSLVFGYCTDALADLVAGAGALYGPSRVTRFFFDAEPAELRWVLRRTGGEEVEVTVYRFPDVGVSPDLPDAEGTVIWRSAQPRSVFARAVLTAARAVLARHGEDGYRERWARHDYPTALVQDLSRFLRGSQCGDQGTAGALDTSTDFRRSQGSGATSEPR